MPRESSISRACSGTDSGDADAAAEAMFKGEGEAVEIRLPKAELVNRSLDAAEEIENIFRDKGRLGGSLANRSDSGVLNVDLYVRNRGGAVRGSSG